MHAYYINAVAEKSRSPHRSGDGTAQKPSSVDVAAGRLILHTNGIHRVCTYYIYVMYFISIIKYVVSGGTYNTYYYRAVIKEEEEGGEKKTGIYHLECEKPTSGTHCCLCSSTNNSSRSLGVNTTTVHTRRVYIGTCVYYMYIRVEAQDDIPRGGLGACVKKR